MRLNEFQNPIQRCRHLAALFILMTVNYVLWAADSASENNQENSASSEQVKPAIATNVPAESRLSRLADLLSGRFDAGSDSVETVWLGQAPAQRLAVFQHPKHSKPNGAVVALLAHGKIVDQDEFSRTFRRILSAGAWAALVVQTDLLVDGDEPAADEKALQLLLSQSIEYLAQQNYSKFVVVAEAEVATAVWPVIQTSQHDLKGFVGIDEWRAEDFEPPIPVLNIANAINPNATQNAERRLNEVIQRPSAACEVFFYDGVLHSDVGYGRLVSRRIRGWLERKFVRSG
ncbi:MAG: hypothetical protein AAF387_00145 [Pseudomonadota bacterium]